MKTSLTSFLILSTLILSFSVSARAAVSDSNGRPIARGFAWRWGGGKSYQHQIQPAPLYAPLSLFEKEKSWGWKEWTIIGGSIAAIAAIVIVATNDSGSSSGGSSGY